MILSSALPEVAGKANVGLVDFLPRSFWLPLPVGCEGVVPVVDRGNGRAADQRHIRLGWTGLLHSWRERREMHYEVCE